MRLAVLGFLFALVAIFHGDATAQTRIEEGQVWTFKNAPSDTARLVIRKIERWEGGCEAVHISVYGLPKVGDFLGEVSHMPFDRKTLEGSLDKLAAEAPRADADFAGGYQEWKSARGGIFTISVAEALKAMLQAVFGPPHSPKPI